eukprot:INCI11165.1.p1 GENE.INCI11165.1~~INCI11165.1.p1  ORF type:complete len:239 (+),score=46.14 INCI11165.1:296-1012(+)
MATIARNLAKVLGQVKEVCTANKVKQVVRLCAVSKTKPVEDLQIAYDAGQRHFGENYVQELVAKAPVLPKDIQWHFIGNLQSNKCKSVAAIDNLFLVETVDRPSIAKALNKACEKVGRKGPLNVLVQVNTSGEDSKSGAETAEEALELVRYIREDCPNLVFKGLMTIGVYGGDAAPCFERLVSIRDKVLELGLFDPETEGQLEMSMGMSGDFPVAIKLGSTNVRVGSSIFGARDYSNK